MTWRKKIFGRLSSPHLLRQYKNNVEAENVAAVGGFTGLLKKKTAYALVKNSSGTLDFLKFTFQNKFLPAV